MDAFPSIELKSPCRNTAYSRGLPVKDAEFRVQGYYTGEERLEIKLFFPDWCSCLNFFRKILMFLSMSLFFMHFFISPLFLVVKG